MAMHAFIVSLLLLGTGAGGVVLSNTDLPLDTSGAPLITGETSVVAVNGTYYFYVNNWGGCKTGTTPAIHPTPLCPATCTPRLPLTPLPAPAALPLSVLPLLQTSCAYAK